MSSNLWQKTLCLAVFVMTALLSQAQYRTSEFCAPSMRWRPVPLWFWNNTTLEAAQVDDELQHIIDTDMYGGCAILPFGGNFKPTYLSEEYFAMYGRAIKICKEKGAQMSLYDEYGFPSGSMGYGWGDGITHFKNNHPGHTLKQLNKTEYTGYYPNHQYTLDLSKIEGKIMAVVGYSTSKKVAFSLRPYIKNNVLTWKPPLGYGVFKVLVFNCVVSSEPVVDYLCKESVKLFIEDTHEQYYKRFGEDFGKTITTTFFDEPTLHRAAGRAWTEGFNEKFKEMYGYEPDSLYAALWYDLGDNTQSARNQLYSTRAQLYAEGFMKTIADWAEAHGIESTGHQEQEEILNATCVAADLLLDGKYMQIPGVDKIGGPVGTENIYKVVSSSANNWDHDRVMSETYGAMGNISVDLMYQIAIEQFTKGINYIIPHAVWYNPNDVYFLPELSWRNPLYNKRLKDFNTFLARLSYILQRRGQHVADIAVLYPVQTFQGDHKMEGPLAANVGTVSIANLDYDQVSRLLNDEMGRDFTYLHPTVVDDRCEVEADGTLTMKNPVNTEHFGIIILPGVKTISISNLKKIEQAWERGATVIFTSQKPTRTADGNATSAEIQAIVERMLETEKDKGNAIYVPTLTKENLQAALATHKQVPDVQFLGTETPLNYIHKVIDGHQVYLFGNIDGGANTCTVALRQPLKNAVLMNPKTGEYKQAELKQQDGLTTVDLTIFPYDCWYLIEGDGVTMDGGEFTLPETADGMTYSIEMKVRVDKLSAGVCFAAQDRENFYMWQINLEQPDNPRLRPHQWMSGGGVSILGDFGFGNLVKPTVGKEFKLKIAVTKGQQADTYINDVMIDSRKGEFAYGMIGFREDHSAEYNSIEAAHFDNVRVLDADGKVLYSQYFSANNPFSAGTLDNGWLKVDGSMGGAVWAWQTDFKPVTTAITPPWQTNDENIIYDLTGARLQSVRNPGIYVINGKKTLTQAGK